MDELYKIESAFYETMQVWAFRVSNVENLSLAKTFEAFSHSGYSKVIVSEETSNKGVIHHHGLLAWLPSDYEVEINGKQVSTMPAERAHETISGVIKRIYPDAKGNRCIYIRQSIDKKQLLKYTLKEGLFFQKGFTHNYISAALLLSTGKEGMKKAFEKNVERYLLGTIDLLTFMSNHIALKVKHQQPLYNNHLLAYFRSVAIRQGDISSVDYAQTFYDKLFSRDY